MQSIKKKSQNQGGFNPPPPDLFTANLGGGGLRPPHPPPHYTLCRPWHDAFFNIENRDMHTHTFTHVVVTFPPRCRHVAAIMSPLFRHVSDNDIDNDNKYDLLNINFIQIVNNYLASYYKKLEVVYVRETRIKAKTTLVKHITS